MDSVECKGTMIPRARRGSASRLTKIVSVRVTDDEYADLMLAKGKLGGITTQVFMRRILSDFMDAGRVIRQAEAEMQKMREGASHP